MIKLLQRLRGTDKPAENEADASARAEVERRHRQYEDEIRIARLVKEQRLRGLGQ